MRRTRSIVTLTAFLTLVTLAAAEIPNRSRAQLLQGADVAVVARVQAVYSRTEQGPKWRRTFHVAELAVQKVEKGALGKTQLIYARYGRRAWVGGGMPPTGSYGHRGLPEKGQTVRVYLQRAKDGGLDVILPNGFAPAK